MPMTDSNWPAIDEVAESSTTEELRATSALLIATGPLEGLAHRGMRGDVGAGVDRVGERRRQHHAGEDVQPGGGGPGKCRRLAAREPGVERRGLIEGDHQRSLRGGRLDRGAQIPSLIGAPSRVHHSTVDQIMHGSYLVHH